MHHTFKPRGVCSSQIDFDIENGKVKNVVFLGGCNGNLKAIALLAEGMQAQQVAQLLKGNTCGFKNTSCADQFSTAINLALQQEDSTQN